MDNPEDKENLMFDYATSGLADNTKWKVAAAINFEWLKENMLPRYGAHGIVNFMHNQPIRAANNVMNNCDGWSEESITLLLIGQVARANLIASDEHEQRARAFFGDRTVDLLKTTYDSKFAVDADMIRDAGRITLAEAISNMSDQMVDRHLFEKQSSRFAFHDQRKMMLQGHLDNYAVLKGVDPKLDVIFEEFVAKSKLALDTIDKEIETVKKQKPKGPGM